MITERFFITSGESDTVYAASIQNDLLTVQVNFINKHKNNYKILNKLYSSMYIFWVSYRYYLVHFFLNRFSTMFNHPVSFSHYQQFYHQSFFLVCLKFFLQLVWSHKISYNQIILTISLELFLFYFSVQDSLL